MKKNYLGILAAIVLGFIGLSSVSLAQNGTQTNKIDLTGWLANNPCCGEWVDITGTMHVTSKITENADGTITFDTKSNLSNVKGTGAVSGTSYNFMQNTSTSQTFDPNSPAFSFDQKVRYRAVGKGSDGRECSATLVITIHFEVDENGNVVASVSEVVWECANGTDLN